MHTLTELGTRLAGRDGEKRRAEVTRKLMDAERRLRVAMADQLLPQAEFQRFATTIAAIDFALKVVASAAELPNPNLSQPVQ